MNIIHTLPLALRTVARSATRHVVLTALLTGGLVIGASAVATTPAFARAHCSGGPSAGEVTCFQWH